MNRRIGHMFFLLFLVTFDMAFTWDAPWHLEEYGTFQRDLGCARAIFYFLLYSLDTEHPQERENSLYLIIYNITARNLPIAIMLSS